MKLMTSAEKLYYGSLIANFLAYRITAEEEKILHEWVCADDENMDLFESLIDDMNQEWAKKWFYVAGVSTRSIKWKKRDGWYKPETKAIADFYIVMAVVFAFLLLVYFVLEFT